MAHPSVQHPDSQAMFPVQTPITGEANNTHPTCPQSTEAPLVDLTFRHSHTYTLAEETMDLIDHLKSLSSRLPGLSNHVQTEEATKHAIILPFISALGYNVFDPSEVVPEMNADVGTKKGEKVDYAIMRDGKPIILVEAKACSVNLDDEHASQLYRYFNVTDARFAILTNGIRYQFFSDIDEKNRMDAKPFYEFNLLDFRDHQVDALKRFTKAAFDTESLLSAATELKYTHEIKRLLGEQLQSPTEDFVKYITSRVYTGVKTSKVLTQFTDITQRALKQFITERINERLKSAMSEEGIKATVGATPAGQLLPGSGLEMDGGTAKSGEDCNGNVAESMGAAGDTAKRIVTTEDEIEAYHIVKAILRETIDPKRIVIKDTISYCGVLLDDNCRKPICRFRFSPTKKQLALIGENKEEDRVPIEDLNDIFKYSPRIVATVNHYDQFKT